MIRLDRGFFISLHSKEVRLGWQSKTSPKEQRNKGQHIFLFNRVIGKPMNDNIIYIDNKGNRVSPPKREDYTDIIEWMRAHNAFMDRIHDDANSAFTEAFLKEMRKQKKKT